ncbi:hypothetical protein MP638_006909 [Amoeboaphelidium occidentale]|nr:hypothetical protein MP638_006909 [Amoeboaphelidium occidentale]
MPSPLLRAVTGRNNDEVMRWREKFTLFILTLGLSGGVFYLLDTASKLTCGMMSQPFFTLESLEASNNLFAQNGKVVDTDLIKNETKLDVFKKNVGEDLTGVFPSFTALGRLRNSVNYLDPDIQACINGDRARQIADAWLTIRLRDPGYTVEGGRLRSCPLPGGTQSDCYFTAADRDEIRGATIGDIRWNATEVKAKNDIGGSKVFVIVSGKVYDLGRYLNIATRNDNGRFVVNQDTAFLGSQMTQALLDNVGGDASSSVNSISNNAVLLRCMDRLFYAGLSSEASSGQQLENCKMINPLWFSLAGLFLILTLPKFLMGCCSDIPVTKEPLSDAHVMFIVKCEGGKPEDMQLAIQSMLNVRYTAANKLMVFVVDGDDSATCREVLKSLAFDPNVHYSSEDVSYTSLGEGYKSSNSLKMYSGMNGANAYIVIHKKGSSSEQPQKEQIAGHRGSRDTLHMLLSFLNKAIKPSSSTFSPFEYEFFKVLRRLHLDARRFEYALLLSGNTVVEAESVLRMVDRMDNDGKLGMLQGRLLFGSSNLLRYYPFFIDTHLQSSINSAFGHFNVNTISSVPNSSMLMLRLKYSDGTPLMQSQNVLETLSNELNAPGSRMHLANCFYRGEDKYAAIALLKEKDYGIGYERHALGKILVNDGLYSSFEKTKTRDLSLLWNRFSDGSSCCGNLVALFGIISLLFLPLATVLFYYLLVTAFLGSSVVVSNIIVAVVLLVPHFVSIVASLFYLDFKLLFSILIHIVIGIPLFNFILPLLALWNLDKCFKHQGKRHGAVAYEKGSQKFQVSNVPQYLLHEWETAEKEGKLGELMSPLSRNDYYHEYHGTVVDMSQIKSNDLDLFVPDRQQDGPEGEYYDNQETLVSSTAFTNNPASVYTRQETPGAFSDDLLRARESVMTKYTSQHPVAPPRMNHRTINSRDTVRVASPKSEFPSVDDTETQRNTSSNQQSFYYRPTNFEGKKSENMKPKKSKKKMPNSSSSSSGQRPDSVKMPTEMSPMRATSMARSDYQSDFDYADSDVKSRAFNRDTQISTFSQMSKASKLDRDTGVSKEDIKDEIRFFLQDADLNAITRREVKDHLFVQFGQDSVEKYNEFINICIEEFTLEKLALI